MHLNYNLPSWQQFQKYQRESEKVKFEWSKIQVKISKFLAVMSGVQQKNAFSRTLFNFAYEYKLKHVEKSLPTPLLGADWENPMIRLNSRIFWIFEISEWNLILCSSDCKALKII